MIKYTILGHPKSKNGAFRGQFTPNEQGRGVVFTPNSLWDLMCQEIETRYRGRTGPPLNEGVVLDRWVVRDYGNKTQGLASVIGPELSNDAEVTLYVRKADA